MTSDRGVCAVVLAAGLGSRLAPLTDTVPKALCPVGNRPLLDWALGRLAAAGFAGPDTVAVNVHHHRDAMLAELATYTDPPQVSLEAVPLGTAGALGALRDWIDGRDTLVVNADAFFSPDAAVVRTLLSGIAIDCGTPGDYLRANLLTSGGASVIGADAHVAGTVTQCVVWPGAWVGAHEHLRKVIRAGTRTAPVTVPAG